MTEYVIDEDEYRAAMRKAYEAGATGREVYTARDCLTRELVRCRDCKHAEDMTRLHGCWFCRRCCCASFPINPDGFCAWGERRDDA